jgi:hypothetical protein
MMRRRGVEKFLHRYDKDPDLQRRFAEDPKAVQAEFGLSDDERDVLARHDIVQLHRWGLHALLIRNFAGFLKIDYVAQFQRAGIFN